MTNNDDAENKQKNSNSVDKPPHPPVLPDIPEKKMSIPDGSPIDVKPEDNTGIQKPPENNFQGTICKREILSKYERYELMLLGLGIVVAIGTIIVTGIGIKKQLTEMKRNSGDVQTQIGQIHQQIVVLNKSAEATRDMVNIAQEADRPWVGVKGDPLVETIDEGVFKTRITMFFINAGKSPAKILDVHGAANFMESFIPVLKNGPERQHGQAILVPGMGTTSAVRYDFNKDDINKIIENGKIKFYIYGKVNYRDIRTGRCYQTTSCFIKSKGGRSDYITCEEYNNATEEKCPKE